MLYRHFYKPWSKTASLPSNVEIIAAYVESVEFVLFSLFLVEIEEEREVNITHENIIKIRRYDHIKSIFYDWNKINQLKNKLLWLTKGSDDFIFGRSEIRSKNLPFRRSEAQKIE